MRWVTAMTVLATVLAMAMAAQAEDQALHSVKVQVIDIGGGRVFVTPGEKGGLVQGTEVVFGANRFKVEAVSSTYAVVDLEKGRPPEVGASGEALVGAKVGAKVEQVEQERHRDVPVPVDAYREVWPEPTLPATTKEQVHVPLGRERPTRARLGLSLGANANIGFRGRPSTLAGYLRARLLSEPISGVPLRIDADLEGQFWYAQDIDQRSGGSSRPYLEVRALQVSYGEDTGFYAALGRLRYAASTLGMLDGARIQSPSIRGFTFGAFGGLMPHPFTGITEWDVGRFGVEIGYQDLSSRLRPMASLVAHGSVFGTDIDERRLSLEVGLFPGDSRVGAHLETSFHNKDNTWNVPVAEVSAAGVDGAYRRSWFEIGARFDMRRPERSLWLDSILPSSWLCAATVTMSGEPEPCSGDDDTRYFGSLRSSFLFGRGSVNVGATVLHFATTSDVDQVGGYIQGRVDRLFGFGRVGLSIMASHGSYVDLYAARLSLGGSFLRGLLDVSLFYRASYSMYPADRDGWLGHLFGGAILVHPVSDLYISLQTDGVVGRDVNAMIIQVLATWSPSF
jgi:hypothetical protein